MQQYILAYPGISRQYIEAVPDFRYYPPRRVTTPYEAHSPRVSNSLLVNINLTLQELIFPLRVLVCNVGSITVCNCTNIKF